MQQAATGDDLLFDPLPPAEDVLAATEGDVRGAQEHGEEPRPSPGD